MSTQILFLEYSLILKDIVEVLRGYHNLWITSLITVTSFVKMYAV